MSEWKNINSLNIEDQNKTYAFCFRKRKQRIDNDLILGSYAQVSNNGQPEHVIQIGFSFLNADDLKGKFSHYQELTPPDKE